MDLIHFLKVIIKPEFITLQEEFYTSRNPLNTIKIAVNKDEKESYIPSSPLSKMVLRVNKNKKKKDKKNIMNITSSSPLKSVVTIDSFKGRNQNYIKFS